VKILVYGLNFAPELTGIGKYTGEMAAWLADRGHEVRVVTAPPYYPEWKVPQGYSSWRWRTDAGAALRTWRCPLWVPRRAGGLKRIVHLLSFALSSFPVLLRQAFWRPDLVWTVEPALACAPGALLLARLTRAKSWLHIQDFEVDAAFSMGLLKGNRIQRFFLGAERRLMQRFDRVSTISGRMMDLARSKGQDGERLVYFPNWVDMSLINPQASSTYRQELGIGSDEIVALYSGNMGNKQGLDILAKLAGALSDQPGITFVFSGDGTGKADLVALCEGLKNVRFLALQPLRRLSDLLALADVHLLPQRADAADLVMPSKLSGMLASARPVIATAAQFTELAEVVSSKAHCGLVVSPEDVEAFATAMRRLAADPSARRSMGQAGRRFAESELDRDAILGRFEDDMVDLTGQQRTNASKQYSPPAA
jgi:colanic acid biosynthesis glycosyl transferase WcaI